MTEEELKEMMALLEAAGCSAQLCDTPVPLSGSTVKCGLPTEPGDVDYSDYVLLPKAVVGLQPEMMIPAEGDSMREAGFEPGDLLRVRFGMEARDGDSVLAWIDGQCTVKSLFTDEEVQGIGIELGLIYTFRHVFLVTLGLYHGKFHSLVFKDIVCLLRVLVASSCDATRCNVSTLLHQYLTSWNYPPASIP